MSQPQLDPSAPARTRNRRGEGGLLRRDILQATLGLLDDTGTAAAVTLRSVAKRAGIAPPSIYAHFAGPEAILLAVVAEEFAHLREDLRTAVERAGDDALDRLRAMCDGYLAFAHDFPARYLLLFGGVWNATEAASSAGVARETVAALGVDLLEDLTDLLRACVRDGASTSDDPATDAAALWLGLHGLAHQRIVSASLTLPAHIEGPIVERLARISEG